MLNVTEATIRLLRNFQDIFLRICLPKIYKSFATPHFDYSDLIYDQKFNGSFHERLKSIQHNAEVTITAAVKDINS